jgi:hypothetical protein
MRAELAKKLILGVAAVALVAVWSRNLLLFYPGHPEARNNPATMSPRQSPKGPQGNSKGDSLFVFRDDVRDPFQRPSARPSVVDSTRRLRPKLPLPEPPHASLTGIVWSQTSPHIVVYDSLAKATVVLKQLQWINEYQVRSISRKKVLLRSKRQSFVWIADD